jgi:hypothetical protein
LRIDDESEEKIKELIALIARAKELVADSQREIEVMKGLLKKTKKVQEIDNQVGSTLRKKRQSPPEDKSPEDKSC